MKVLNKARLDALERALKSKDGVLVVEHRMATMIRIRMDIAAA